MKEHQSKRPALRSDIEFDLTDPRTAERWTPPPASPWETTDVLHLLIWGSITAMAKMFQNAESHNDLFSSSAEVGQSCSQNKDSDPMAATRGFLLADSRTQQRPMAAHDAQKRIDDRTTLCWHPELSHSANPTSPMLRPTGRASTTPSRELVADHGRRLRQRLHRIIELTAQHAHYRLHQNHRRRALSLARAQLD